MTQTFGNLVINQSVSKNHHHHHRLSGLTKTKFDCFNFGKQPQLHQTPKHPHTPHTPSRFPTAFARSFRLCAVRRMKGGGNEAKGLKQFYAPNGEEEKKNKKRKKGCSNGPRKECEREFSLSLGVSSTEQKRKKKEKGDWPWVRWSGGWGGWTRKIKRTGEKTRKIKKRWDTNYCVSRGKFSWNLVVNCVCK